MSEQDNYLFKVIGSMVMRYSIEKPDPETLAIAQKIIDLVEKATEARIMKLLDEEAKKASKLAGQAPDYVAGIPMRGMVAGYRHAIALIKEKAEPKPEITPQQLQINEIFQQANRDIAKLAGTMDTMGPKIDEIMANARADANAIREGKAE